MGCDRIKKRKQKDFFKREGKKKRKLLVHGKARDKDRVKIVPPGASCECLGKQEGGETGV